MKGYLKFGIPLFLLFLLSCYSTQMSSSAQDATATPQANASQESATEVSKDGAPPQISFFNIDIVPFEKDKRLSAQIEGLIGWADLKDGAEFDVVNEYGYLGKGKLRFVKKEPASPGYWLAEIERKDMLTNINELCKTRMQEREKESPGIPAVGIFPNLPGRSKTATAESIDMRPAAVEVREALYRSLPQEVLDRANVYGQKGSLEYPNSWADLNGDGMADYVSIRVTCAEMPNSHCVENLVLHNDKWIKVPEKK